MPANWDEALDDMELVINEAEASLDAGTDLPDSLTTPFEPPADLGELTGSQLDRARVVLQRQSDLERRIVTHKDAVARDLSSAVTAGKSKARKSPFSDSSTPQYFDHKA
jgi:hypothetical protein